MLEPVRRDTAPAIVAAAAVAGRPDLDCPLLVVASDHVVRDVDAFRASVLAGLPAAQAGRLVTFWIMPMHPATEYGYIKPEEALGAIQRLENLGNTRVELIEVQHGDYLGEDDIVRLEDAYHRV